MVGVPTEHYSAYHKRKCAAIPCPTVSLAAADENERTINMSIGFHDGFIPETEKFGSAVWMNKIIDSIIQQAQLWMFEKAQRIGFDIEQLN